MVVGAGHCGLAMSRCLAERSIDHVVLERGEVANSWRTQRWDSLRLLTPNWMTRLPGLRLPRRRPGRLPRRARQVAALLADYAEASAAPVLTGTTVTSVRPPRAGYLVRTDRGTWHARTVVVATGAADRARRAGAGACRCPPGSPRVTAADYRNPGRLPDGGVLVVGASASGIQIADELHRSGRPVTLAVGEHVRMPRTYRGRDILWWMDAVGPARRALRRGPRPGPGAQPAVDAAGRLAGPRRSTSTRCAGSGCGWSAGSPAIRDGVAQFSGSLPNVCALADLKLGRLLDTIDAWADRAGVDAEPPQRFAPTAVPRPRRWACDLRSRRDRARSSGPPASARTCPGSTSRCSTARAGSSTTAASPPRPGLYLIGLPFLRRRKSTLIDGAAADARDLADHLAGHLDALARRRAS